MTKGAFLADLHVKEMRLWVAARFDRRSGWTHEYVDCRTGRPWSCESLSDAFRQYRWNRESWHENKTKLDAYRHDLWEAVGDDDVDRAVHACERILRWGGVWARNGAYLRRRRSILLDELRHLQAVIDGDHTPLAERHAPGSVGRGHGVPHERGLRQDLQPALRPLRDLRRTGGRGAGTPRPTVL